MGPLAVARLLSRARTYRILALLSTRLDRLFGLLPGGGRRRSLLSLSARGPRGSCFAAGGHHRFLLSEIKLPSPFISNTHHTPRIAHRGEGYDRHLVSLGPCAAKKKEASR